MACFSVGVPESTQVQGMCLGRPGGPGVGHFVYEDHTEGGTMESRDIIISASRCMIRHRMEVDETC